MLRKVTLIIFFLTLFTGVADLSAQDVVVEKAHKGIKNMLEDTRPWTLELPIWIPGFSGEFAYGDVDLEGDSGVDPGDPEDPDDDDKPGILKRLFNKGTKFNYFFIGRFAYEKNRLRAQTDLIGGSIGSNVKFKYNNKEIVQADFSALMFRLWAGYKVYEHSSETFRYELFVYSGLRFYSQRVKSDLNGLEAKLNVNPVWGEVLIGVQNQFTFKRWYFIIQADHGGFDLNNTLSFQYSINSYYRIGRSISLKLGWNHLDVRNNIEIRSKDLKLKIQLSGPAIGFAVIL